MKTAGIIFDFYDDIRGSILKQAFPNSEVLPEFVKQAHILSAEERDVLRDEAYALIMHNEGKSLRKFACVDRGNTFLSAIYFLNNSNLFPEEVCKIAQANIESFCNDFDLDFNKIAKSISRKDREAANKPTSGMIRNRDPAKTPLVGDEADWAARTNLLSVSGGADSGKVTPTAMSMKTASDKDHEKQDFLMGHSKLNPNAKQPKKKKVANVIDVSGLAPAMRLEKKAASRTALNGRYALDSMRDVQEAINYFSDYVFNLDPQDRHVFAVKTASRAYELGLEVPDLMRRYGSTDYAPDLNNHLASRRALAPDFKPVWDELQEKRASIDPEHFAGLLALADEESGLESLYGGDLQDPYYVTFGDSSIQKVAEEDWSWENGVLSVNAEQLRSLADNKDRLSGKFDEYLVDGFSKDPIAIFDSLPANHKAILASMANSGDSDASSDPELIR